MLFLWPKGDTSGGLRTGKVAARSDLLRVLFIHRLLTRNSCEAIWDCSRSVRVHGEWPTEYA